MIALRSLAPVLVPTKHELQTLEVHREIRIRTAPLASKHFRHHLLMINLPLPTQNPQDTFRRVVRNTGVDGHGIHDVEQLGAFFAVFVPETEFFVEAVDVVDDDAEFPVALVDRVQRFQRFVGDAQPGAVADAGGDKA